MDEGRVHYLADWLTVLVLGAVVLWAGSLVVQGKLAAAMRALAGRR